jgi:hypothetical protein
MAEQKCAKFIPLKREELAFFVSTKRNQDDGKVVAESCLSGKTWRFLNHKLGAGSFGVTYEACDQPGGSTCPYVAKIVAFHPKFLESDEKQFRIECALNNHASQCGYGPQVESFLVCGDVEGKRYGIVIMERMAETVEQRFRRGALSHDDIVNMLDTIKRMHDAQVFHSDLSSSNMMFTHNNQARVIDFGMAWPMNQAVRPILRMIDIVTVCSPLIRLVGNRWTLIHDGLTDMVKWMTAPQGYLAKEFGQDKWEELYDTAIRSRVVDYRTMHNCNFLYSKNARAPIQSTWMYIQAIENLSPDVLQALGVDAFMNRINYMHCDPAVTDKNYKDLREILMIRADPRVPKRPSEPVTQPNKRQAIARLFSGMDPMQQ